MSRIFINKFEEGQRISVPFLIKTKQLLSFKSKPGKFMHLILGDKTGDIEGKLWEGAEEAFSLLNDTFVANIAGEVVRYRDSLQLNIFKIEPCQNYSPADFLPESPKSRDEMVVELQQLIASINNPYLASFLKELFADEKLYHNYTLAPAAQHHHQAYLGGLLEHSLSVAAICQALAKVYPAIDRDLLVVGAIIHDIGKIDELSFTDVINYTDEGRLIGHIVIGAQLVSKVFDKITVFPESLKLKILHMIISHHGQYEWQSPKKPKFLEAMILHHADMLDSQVDKFLKVQEKAGEDSTWSPWIKGLDRYLYLS
ncbi:MAG: HD domain-containing protein [Bacillota bacterium]|nr:HD domain-containing protein [Bacillota bacterium]